MSNTNMLAGPENATGQTSLASPFTDKRGFGQRWQFSPRKVADLLSLGMPHLKIGKRRVRLFIPECDQWMQDTFRIQRRGPVAAKGGVQ